MLSVKEITYSICYDKITKVSHLSNIHKRYDSSNRWSIGTNSYDWYQYKKVVIPNGSIGEQKQVEIQTCHENSSFYPPSIQNKFAFTPSRNALIVDMNIPRSININRA